MTGASPTARQLDGLTPAGWAWQFLRRNPDYRTYWTEQVMVQDDIVAKFDRQELMRRFGLWMPLAPWVTDHAIPRRLEPFRLPRAFCEAQAPTATAFWDHGVSRKPFLLAWTPNSLRARLSWLQSLDRPFSQRARRPTECTVATDSTSARQRSVKRSVNGSAAFRAVTIGKLGPWTVLAARKRAAELPNSRHWSVRVGCPKSAKSRHSATRGPGTD